MRKEPNIRFVIRTTSPLIGLARAQARRLIDAGIDVFTREWVVDGVKISARCIKLFDQHVVTITGSGSQVARGIAHLMSRNNAFDYAGAFALPSTPASLSLANDNIDYTGTVPPARDPPVNLFVENLSFTDEMTASANVAPVVASSPIYRHCDVSLGRTTSIPIGIELTRENLARMFDERHGYVLRNIVKNRTSLLKTPASLRNLFQEYIACQLTPLHFWKDADNEVWALCTPVRLDGLTVGTIMHTPHTFMPYTGNYDADRFSDDAQFAELLAQRVVNITVNGIFDSPTPTPVWEQWPFIFVKARLYDLYKAPDFHAKKKVDLAYGENFIFTVFGQEYSAVVNPAVTITEIGFVQDLKRYETGLYDFRLLFEGQKLTVDGRDRFVGKISVESFGFTQTTWKPAEPKPLGSCTPPLPSEGHRRIFDYTSESQTHTVTGTPFEGAEWLDVRASVYPDRPAIISTITSPTLTAHPGPPTRSLTVRMWDASPFTGIGFHVGVSEITLTGGPGAQQKVDHIFPDTKWGLITATAVSSTSGHPKAIYDRIGGALEFTAIQQLNDVKLVRETRGQRVHLGSMNRDYARHSAVNGLTYVFVPTEEMRALGLSEARFHDTLTEEFALYDGRVHVGAKYVEKAPPGWRSSNGFPGFPVRLYNGVTLHPQEPIVSAGHGQVNAVPYFASTTQMIVLTPSHERFTDYHAVDDISPTPGGEFGATSDYYEPDPFDFSSSAGRYHVDTMEYPFPSPFYPAEQDGGAPVDFTRPRLAAVALYYPNLKPGQDGFCLLKLYPAPQFIRAIYFHMAFDATGIEAIKNHANKLRSFTAQPIFNPFPTYKAAIATLSSMADTLYLNRNNNPPPSAEQYAALKEQALVTLRASYEVLANNFAPRELIDVATTSLVIIPRRNKTRIS